MEKAKVASVHARNSLAIEQLSREDIEEHRGEYAVVVDGSIESYHATNREALKRACTKYRYGQFSVQRVEHQPVDMGFADSAADIGTICGRSKAAR